MNVTAREIPSADSTGAPYIAGNFAPLKSEVTDLSDVVILDAQDFTGEPLATIQLPVRVPFGFHGGWAPDRVTPIE